jgi:hypothetical protein
MKENKVCFCNSCWRDEYHSPVQVDGFTRALLVVFTLGFALAFWPYRCRCCGNLRPHLWFARRA